MLPATPGAGAARALPPLHSLAALSSSHIARMQHHISTMHTSRALSCGRHPNTRVLQNTPKSPCGFCHSTGVLVAVTHPRPSALHCLQGPSVSVKNRCPLTPSSSAATWSAPPSLAGCQLAGGVSVISCDVPTSAVLCPSHKDCVLSSIYPDSGYTSYNMIVIVPDDHSL